MRAQFSPLPTCLVPVSGSPRPLLRSSNTQMRSRALAAPSWGRHAPGSVAVHFAFPQGGLAASMPHALPGECKYRLLRLAFLSGAYLPKKGNGKARRTEVAIENAIRSMASARCCIFCALGCNTDHQPPLTMLFIVVSLLRSETTPGRIRADAVETISSDRVAGEGV